MREIRTSVDMDMTASQRRQITVSVREIPSGPGILRSMHRTQEQRESCDEDAIAALKRRISLGKVAHLNDVYRTFSDGAVKSV